MHDTIQPANENLESSSFLILDLLQNSPTADLEGFWQKTEVYLEPCQAYTMEHFGENGQRDFCNTISSYMLDRVLKKHLTNNHWKNQTAQKATDCVCLD